MNVKRLFLSAAVLLLLPLAASADDFSAQLAGTGGAQGFASLRTGGGQITYSIVTNGIGDVTGASVAGVALGASSATGSAAGSVVSGVTDLAGATLTVDGSSGSVSGPVVLAGESGGPGPGAGTVQLAAALATALESDGTVTLTVTRTGGTTGAASVDFTVEDGTATGGVDFAPAAGTLTWADGDGAAKQIVVTLTEDEDEEGAETFEVALSDATGAQLGSPATATVTVLDDDSPCVEDATTLCLAGGRFEVRATFDPPNDADELFDAGQAQPLTADTGYFWFFDAANVEVVVKVLDACTVNQRVWVFAGGLTDVATRITVRDTLRGPVREYENPQQTAFQPIQDTAAFATCP
ncbi:MAG TPA: Calx-beta domain-containing protein [Thermoanaerobaculia bacterium]|nr:Calx-beta domain-containing protein [Thermoanaerobaculia bacterium]